MSAARPGINAKKARLYNSRNIRTHTTDASLVDKDKLNVPDFLNSREFEIKSFELAQLNSKYASSNRAFQSLPRVLRRRAASHNVKRIPKRLRARAIREMKSSITGTSVAKKSRTRGRELYRLNMSKKLLNLGSKLKLLRGVPDREVYGKKLNLRAKIKALSKQIRELKQTDKPVKPKLNNTVGSYDNSGINELASRPTGNIKYYKRQRQFVWLPTHIWHAKRFHMIKQYGFQIPLTPTQKCFKMMSRQSKNDSILFDTSYYTSLVVEIMGDEEFRSFLFSITRFEKSIPNRFLTGERSYNDWLYLDGHKVGKVVIFSHIRSHQILIRCFPSIYRDVFESIKKQLSTYACKTTINDCQYSLGSLDLIGPLSLLSLSKVLHLFDGKSKNKEIWTKLSAMRDSKAIPIGFNINFDIMDPRLWKQPMKLKPSNDTNEYFDFISTLSTSKFIDSASIENLLSSEGRAKSYENQMSIKDIDREFAKISTRETNLLDNTVLQTSKIPIFISKTGQHSWTLIAPWFWILPIWSKLVKVSQIKSGGIRQLKQYNFERGTANFPNDYPWLRDGWSYNEASGKIKHDKYRKVPKHLINNKRPDYKEIDIISPFKCDWTYLRNVTFLAKIASKDPIQIESGQNFGVYEEGSPIRQLNSTHDLKRQCHELNSLYHQEESVIPIDIFNKRNEFHTNFINGSYTIQQASEIHSLRLPVIQISLELVKNGKLHDGARIYLSHTEYDDDNDVSIIGFVTSGSYNINVGIASGIGLVRADTLKDTTTNVYIRNIGQTSFYLAKVITIHN